MIPRILKIVSVLAVLLSSLPARAAERITLWGIYNGCERIAELDRMLDRHLSKAGVTTWQLSPPPSACQGEVCAERAQAGCGLADGYLLGGRIWRSKASLRVRLWLYDLAAHKTAYEDEYCQDCEVNQILVEVTDRIRKNPKFGAAGGAEPAYCTATTSQIPADPRRNKLHYLVYGEGKGRTQLQAGLKDMLSDTLRPLNPVQGEKKQYSHDELMRILGQKNEGQVLGVELFKEGGAQVWLFDGMTERLASQDVKCKECKPEDLIQSIHSTLPELWGHCFDTQCSVAFGRPPASTDACEALKELTCNEAPQGPGPKNPSTLSTSSFGTDPKVARTIKALTWGGFAAAGATAIGLFIANAAGAGAIDSDESQLSNPLIRPAWTALGLAGLSLCIAIPTTIVLDRSRPLRSVTTGNDSATTSSSFRCPK